MVDVAGRQPSIPLDVKATAGAERLCVLRAAQCALASFLKLPQFHRPSFIAPTS